jgi:hypothetical protein
MSCSGCMRRQAKLEAKAKRVADAIRAVAHRSRTTTSDADLPKRKATEKET